MVRGACHCTAIRFELAEAPASVLDCSCTLCRRYGAIWTYPGDDTVKLVRGAGESDIYSWNEKILAFHRCKTCGCVTHFTALDTDPPRIVGINARMIPTLDPARVPLRQIDNGHTGFFWTRSADPRIPGNHPKMSPPGPDDWQ